MVNAIKRNSKRICFRQESFRSITANLKIPMWEGTSLKFRPLGPVVQSRFSAKPGFKLTKPRVLVCVFLYMYACLFQNVSEENFH